MARLSGTEMVVAMPTCSKVPMIEWKAPPSVAFESGPVLAMVVEKKLRCMALSPWTMTVPRMVARVPTTAAPTRTMSRPIVRSVAAVEPCSSRSASQTVARKATTQQSRKPTIPEAGVRFS